MPKISIIIPSYKDPLLNKTVESLLTNSEDSIEIICVMDGYWQAPVADERVRVLHLGKNQGMRNAINMGVAIAQGEYIMRTDEHCVFGPGYDRILTERFRDNWIVYPMRYYLDTIKWEVMDLEPNIYNKLIIDTKWNKFAGIAWKERQIERPTKMIDDSMAMQGSCWIMKKKWWEAVIKELDDRYGDHYGDSHEMVFKTWKAGGRLLVNKNTWYAHKHRDFKRTHNYPIEKARPGWQYALDLWTDYYNNEVRPKWKI